MVFGWAGRILRVDLSKMESSEQDTEPYSRNFIGGRGINVKIMYDEVDPKVSPFDPANRLCLGPGALSGTLAPAHSRTKVTSLSPNGLLANSGIGGFIGAEIRLAGYDNLIIQGKSDRPIYLYIHDDSVEFKDASHLWGKDTQETQEIVKNDIGTNVSVMCIGPGGENLVSFGSIQTGIGNTSGRGGFGAIMGSKNLKAVAVKGTRGIRIAKLPEFITECERASKFFREQWAPLPVGQGGDRYTLNDSRNSGEFIVGNWEVEDANWNQVGEFDDCDEFWERYSIAKPACFGCPLAHFDIFSVPGIGTGAMKCVGHPATGGALWNSDLKVMFNVNYLVDRYGLDVTSTSNCISFLMELYHRGIINERDTDGIPMKRGDAKAIISAVHKIGKQEGFGKLFRDGVMAAAKTIGRGAEDCAMTVNGLEMQPYYEVRAFKAQALGMAVATRDVVEDLAFVEFMGEGGMKVAEEAYGSKEAAIPNSYEKKAIQLVDFGDINTVDDLLGTCKWVIPFWITRSLEIPVKLFSLATGQETSEEELRTAAQRVRTLERAFNVTKGIRRKDDTLPKRIFETAVPDGPFKGERLDRKKFNKMLDEYYALRGWDADGIPTGETFKKFALISEWTTFKKRLGKDMVLHS